MVVMASDDATTRTENQKNFGGYEEYSRSDLTASRQCGRRKSKSKAAPQKKRQPLRGMGVAQLEERRMQEIRWKKMTAAEIMSNPLPSLKHYFVPSSFPHQMQAGAPAPYPKFGSCGSTNATGYLNQALFLQSPAENCGLYEQVGVSAAVVGRGGAMFPEPFQADPYGMGASSPGLMSGINISDENSKELSSIPIIKCYSDHCGHCHKKKRVDGEKLGFCGGTIGKHSDLSSLSGCSLLALSLGNKQSIGGDHSSWDFGDRASIHYADDQVNQAAAAAAAEEELMMMAVDRKMGNSCGRRVLTEYEFFVGGKGGSSCRGAIPKDQTLYLQAGSSEAASELAAVEDDGEGSCVDAAAASRTTNALSYAGFDASANSVDLSLKLSY